MYLALYRKYRPKTFDDVISQSHITTTLTNQIKTGSAAHAYLFTGSRGTGKTTCAKILAMALNCQNPQNGSPCLECASCKEIENGTPDISEIDAASNNGVDDVRALRDEVAYLPVSCKYRVYIIDEVHMLSINAFNALLKTLEEPPPHVVFILATTESHKVPATILSRCQRFEFRRIDMEDSARRLMHIAELEKINLDKNAALLISRLSDGGMRDALSILDQCIGISDNVTTAVVRESAGVAGREHLFALADCIKSNDTASALVILDELHRSSKDIGRLIEELIGHFRNLMLLKVMPDDVSLVTALPDELDQFRQQNEGLSMSLIMRALSLLQECGESLSRTKQRKTLAEMYIIKLCNPTADSSANALAQRVERLENAVSGGTPLALPRSTASDVGQAAAESELKEKNDIVKRPVSSAVSSMLDKIHELANARANGVKSSDTAVAAKKEVAETKPTEVTVKQDTSETKPTEVAAKQDTSETKPTEVAAKQEVAEMKPTEVTAKQEVAETPVFVTSEELPTENEENDSVEAVSEESDIDGQVGFDMAFGVQPTAEKTVSTVAETSEEIAPEADSDKTETVAPESESVSPEAHSGKTEAVAPKTTTDTHKSDESPVESSHSTPTESLTAQAEAVDTLPLPDENASPAMPDEFLPPPFDDYGAPPPEIDELPPPEYTGRNLKTRLPDVAPEKPPVVTKKVEFEQGDFTPDESSLVARWNEITANAPAALSSLLNGSKAYFHESFIHVYPTNGMLESFMGIGSNRERLENAAKDVLGTRYKIVVVPPKITNVGESNAIDKLFARARELDINVKIIEK